MTCVSEVKLVATKFCGIFAFVLITLLFGNCDATDQGKVDCGAYHLDSTTTFHISSDKTTSSKCTWQFLGTPDCYPSITCSTFHLQDSYLCLRHEYLTLSDGTNDEGARYCGNEGPGCSVSQTSILVVTLNSEETTYQQQRKFECTISCVANPGQSYGSYYGRAYGSYGTSSSAGSYGSSSASTGGSYSNPTSCSSTSQYNSYSWIQSSPLRTTDCACGLRGPLGNQDTQTRTTRANAIEGADASIQIVGGHNAKLGEYRMQVAQVYPDSNDIRCGGTLVNNYHVLTAAHCCVDENGNPLPPRSFDYLLNAYDLNNPDKSVTIRRDTEAFIPHPLYDPSTTNYDVCVCRLVESVNLRRSYSEPILRTTCLPPRRETDQFVGVNATITGWGATSEDGPTSNILQEVVIPIISNKKCNEEYGGQITNQMMCAEKDGGGQDSCQGDSGGPAFKKVEYGERYEQIGVVSWGWGCARPGLAGVYARLTELSDWVRMVARDGLWCRELQPKHSGSSYSAAPQQYGSYGYARARVVPYVSYVHPRYLYLYQNYRQL